MPRSEPGAVNKRRSLRRLDQQVSGLNSDDAAAVGGSGRIGACNTGTFSSQNDHKRSKKSPGAEASVTQTRVAEAQGNS